MIAYPSDWSLQLPHYCSLMSDYQDDGFGEFVYIEDGLWVGMLDFVLEDLH